MKSKHTKAQNIAPQLPDDLIDEMRYYIEGYVAAGFLTEDEIVHSAAEILSEGQSPDRLKPAALELTRFALAHHLSEQSSWPQTDCDKINLVFEELDGAGIIARQNYWCCCTCSSTAISKEIEELTRREVIVRGYLFYHGQNTIRAVDGCGLCLHFGSVDNNEDAACLIGDEISDALQRQKLSFEWDGTSDSLIEVELDWKKRRKADGSPEQSTPSPSLGSLLMQYALRP